MAPKLQPYADHAEILADRLRGPAWPCVLRPVLSANARHILFHLLQRVDRGRESVLMACSISQFVPKPPATIEIGTWLEAVADFALVDVRTRAASPLVMDANTSPRVLRILEAARCPYVLLDTERGPLEEAERILHTVDRRGDTSVFCSYGSVQQWLLAHHLRAALWLSDAASNGVVCPDGIPNDPVDKENHARVIEETSWVLLEEVSLGYLVQFPRCPYVHLSRFLSRSSVDLVVVSTGEGQPSIPLLAIEFDGKHHEDPEQRLKDRLKDHLLADAGIALLRIRYTDTKLRRWSTASTEDYANMARVLSPLLRVVRLLVNVVSRGWRTAGQDAAYDQACNRRSRELFGRPMSDLGQEEYDRLMSDEAIQDVTVDHQVGLMSEEQSQQEAKQLESLPEWLRHRGVDPDRVQNFTYSRKHMVWTASASYSTLAGAVIPIELPQITLRLTGASDTELESAVRHCYYEQVVAAIEEIEVAPPQ